MRWAHRLALVTVGATLVLIVAGGLVTNTGAALAVPDWPTTFGHNMFLYPWSQMVGGVLYEHSHRLLGALVGFLTLGLATVLWFGDRQGRLRLLGLAAVVLVGGQGLLGGLRVLLLRDTLAIVHGCLAQAFFALTVALAVFTAPAWRAPVAPLPAAEARRLWGLAVAATAALYLQIVLGALTTHAGRIDWHLGGAVVATLAVALLALRVLARHRARAALAWPAGTLLSLLALQLGLGLGAYVARFTGFAVPGGVLGGLVLPVAHRATAALLLGGAVMLVLTLGRLGGAEAAEARAQLPAGPGAQGVAA
jgi:cytochrome c oxidase assembly protein subunit 15